MDQRRTNASRFERAADAKKEGRRTHEERERGHRRDAWSVEEARRCCGCCVLAHNRRAFIAGAGAIFSCESPSVA